MLTSVPIFCCNASRNKAYAILRQKFPNTRIQIETVWAGDYGLEIEAKEEELQTVIDYIKSDLSVILDHFVCIN